MAIDIKVYPYLSPRIIEVLEPTTVVSMQELLDAVRAWEDSFVGMDYPYLIDASGKEDLGSGTTVGITVQLKNAQIAFSQRDIVNTTGTVTTGDTSGFILTDSTATFITNGVVPGAVIINFTDGSIGTVLDVISETELALFEPLTEGTDNQWDISDAYKVWNLVQCEAGGGNLTSVDSFGATSEPIFTTFGTYVTKTSSSSATLQELTDIRFASYGGGVHIDVDNISGKATSGTAHPIGTARQPVNNLSDLLLILQGVGLGSIFVIGDLTVTSPFNFSGYSFIGESALKSTITINSGVTITGAEFKDATITGYFSTNQEVEDCILSVVNNIGGLIKDCGFTSTISIQAGILTEIWSNKSRIPGTTTPVLDMNATGILSCRDYEGGLKLINYSGASAHTLAIQEGQIILDSATITSGTFVARGIGKLVDEIGTAIPTGTWNGGVTIINELLTAGSIGGGSSVWTTAEKEEAIAWSRKAADDAEQANLKLQL